MCLRLDITLDALLMTIIGGVGTLIGPIIGAGVHRIEHSIIYPVLQKIIRFSKVGSFSSELFIF